MLVMRPLSPLACWSRGLLTTCGVRPTAAGRKNASHTPMPTWSSASCQTSATPAMSRAAVVHCSPKRRKSATSITF